MMSLYYTYTTHCYICTFKLYTILYYILACNNTLLYYTTMITQTMSIVLLLYPVIPPSPLVAYLVTLCVPIHKLNIIFIKKTLLYYIFYFVFYKYYLLLLAPIENDDECIKVSSSFLLHVVVFVVCLTIHQVESLSYQLLLVVQLVSLSLDLQSFPLN